MPAAADDAMGLKLVSFYPGNAGTDIPTHLAVILLFRPDTGEPLAVMDGRLITEMRTAAVSAVVTRHLALPESRVLGLLGSGVRRAPIWRRSRVSAVLTRCECGAKRQSTLGVLPRSMVSWRHQTRSRRCGMQT